MDYEQLRKIIDDKLATDPEFRTLVKRINSGRANFIDTSRYSQILSQTIGKELSKSIESITDKEAITQQLLKDSYNEINDVCARVQEMIDSDAGVHINPQQASFPKERVESFSHSLVDLTVVSDVIRRRARAGSETITKSFHDSYIKKNAQFRNDAGFNCYIVREGRSCCKWCADVAGKYKFGEQPDGIFRRHDNCNCTIIYDGQTMRGKFNSDGTRSKTWEEIPDAEADFSPTVLSKAEAEKIERRNLENFRGLYIDKSGESGIIRENSKPKPITEITDKAIESVPKVNISGYTDEQCAMIQKQHKELLEYSREHNDNKEVAFVFDGSFESRKEFMGSDDKIDFGRGLYGSNITVLHNHPRNSSYSVTDIIFFGDNSNVKTLTIVKNNGKVEYLTKNEKFDSAVFKLEYDRLYRKIVKNGTDSEKDKFVKNLLNKSKSGVIWSERT